MYLGQSEVAPLDPPTHRTEHQLDRMTVAEIWPFVQLFFLMTVNCEKDVCVKKCYCLVDRTRRLTNSKRQQRTRSNA